MDEHGWLMPDETLHFHVEPFEGANLQPEALALTGLTRMTRSAGPSANTMPCMPSSKWCAKDEERLQPGNHGGAQCHL